MANSSGLTIYDHLYVYAGSGRERFLLQHVVDAHHAHTATEDTKPVVIIMALVGLYLHVERGFTGLEVQQAHMKLGRAKRVWPTITLPQIRGTITPQDVMNAPEGDERDAAISSWCRTVWENFAENRNTIVDLLRQQRVS